MVYPCNCNECSWKITKQNNIWSCLHPKAKLGQKPFPKCQGNLWQKSTTKKEEEKFVTSPPLLV